MVNLVHPEISEILDGQLRPESLYRIRRGRGRPTIRSATTNAVEGEELAPGGEGREGGGQHEEISSITVPVDGDSPTDG